jgi:hypothetical protein
MNTGDNSAIAEDSSNAETKPKDEPLFVLRYESYKLGLRFAVLGILGLCFGMVFFCYPLRASSILKGLFLRVSGGLLLGLVTYQFIDLLLFQEIRLYKNRMVKVRALCRPIQVELANARLAGLTFVLASGRRLVSKDAGIIFRNFGGLWWDENLADPDQLKQLNTLLAKLSSRPVEDFKGLYISKKPLIKKD